MEVSRRRARSDVVSLPSSLRPAGEKHRGSLASGSKVLCQSRSCAASRREHGVGDGAELPSLAEKKKVVPGDQSIGKKHRALWWSRRQVPKLCEIVWMMPLL